MAKGILKPVQQGHVDGMCAVYSVLNACNLLIDDPSPDPDDQLDKDTAFFKALCQSVADLFPKLVYDGTEGDGLERVLKRAKRWVATREKRKLEYSPFLLRSRGGSVDDYFRALREALSCARGERRAYILGLGKPWDHWTVVRSVGRSDASFFDSWGFPSEKRTKAYFDEFSFDKKAEGVASGDRFLIDYTQGFLLKLT